MTALSTSKPLASVGAFLSVIDEGDPHHRQPARFLLKPGSTPVRCANAGSVDVAPGRGLFVWSGLLEVLEDAGNALSLARAAYRLLSNT